MNTAKTSLAVAALENGTVIDHIPPTVLFDVVRLLGIENTNSRVTIGNNLPGAREGSKGIIKVEGMEFDTDTLSRIALLAPKATVNIIRNYRVYSKATVELPEELRGIVRCSNPKCITNHEPMPTRFSVGTSEEGVTLRCRYCHHTIEGSEAEIV